MMHVCSTIQKTIAVEVYQVKQIHARYDRVLAKLESMLGEPPVFGLMPRGTSSVPE
jgi:hypothetical protein